MWSASQQGDLPGNDVLGGSENRPIYPAKVPPYQIHTHILRPKFGPKGSPARSPPAASARRARLSLLVLPLLNKGLGTWLLAAKAWMSLPMSQAGQHVPHLPKDGLSNPRRKEPQKQLKITYSRVPSTAHLLPISSLPRSSEWGKASSQTSHEDWRGLVLAPSPQRCKAVAKNNEKNGMEVHYGPVGERVSEAGCRG